MLLSTRASPPVTPDLHPDPSDRQRRLQVFYAISVAALLALVGYAIVNLLEGDAAEMWIDITLAALVTGCIAAVARGAGERVIYRIFLGGMATGLGLLVALGAGDETALYYPLMLPLLLFFFLGRAEGAVAAVTFLLCMAVLVLLPSLTSTHPYETGNSLRFLVAYGLLTLIGWSHEAARLRFQTLLLDNNRQLQREKRQLQDALSHIKTLKGLIPICSSCHRIRNDDGYWQQVETYLSERSDVDFSHSICPDCEPRLYPDLPMGPALQKPRR